ncbi:MAG: hypothetical protein HDKAJFGB_03462 [Anaerolineae bacterium]|nr:hypothetical protein [Anaerolineae bacterium]RIK17801.1 MAG: hypothetical protein DCC52_16605 [Chloroflexota bacterium]
MNLVNRIIVVLLLIAAFVFSCAGFFVMLLARNSIATTVQPTLNALTDPTQIFPLLFCLGLAVLVAVLALLLLYAELMPSGKVRMRLKSIQGADVMMSADAIVTQLQFALDPLPGVINVTPKVSKGKDDAVDVLVELATTSDISVKQKTDEVMDVTRSVLEGGLGLRVGKVQIKIDQMKAPKKGAPSLPKMDLPRLISAKQEEANDNAAK